MTYSTSHKLYLRLAILLICLPGFAFLKAPIASADESPKESGVISGHLLARLDLKTNSRPRWARFSPADSNLILLDIDDQGFLASLPAGFIRGIPNGMRPVGWLGPTVIARDQSGRFHLLNASNLNRSETVAVGVVPLPWPFGKDHRLWFDIALPSSGIATIHSPVPDAEVKNVPLVAREQKDSLSIDSKGAGDSVIDSNGKTVFRGAKKIYTLTLSPDTYKLVVYYGNTEHVLFNRITGRATKLPDAIESWVWLPDSSTLIGQVSTPASARFEAIAATVLYLFDPVAQKLDRIELPPPVQGAALRILDISMEGNLLVEAERVIPQPAHLGLMILELKRLGPNK